jgi:hypothetical protein
LGLISLPVWILAALIVLEAILEVRSVVRNWNTPLILPFLHGHTSQSLPAGAGTEAFGPTSRFPFRSRIVPIGKRDETRRLWMMSASYGEDPSTPAEQIFPNILERQAPCPCRQVLNASKVRERLAGNVEDLRGLGPIWKPDTVVLYQMSLEIGDLSAKYDSFNRTAGIFAGAPRHGLAPEWPGAFIENTTGYSLVHARFAPIVAMARPLPDDLPSEADQEFATNMQGALDAVSSVGAQAILCTFATSHTLRDRGSVPATTRLFLAANDPYLSSDGWLTVVDRYNSIIRRIASERGIPLADVSSVVSGHPEYFRDFVHFTVQGHRAVAAVIERALP